MRGLRKSFDGHEVLRGLDLDLERGKINVIIGASGSGKTVLLKHLAALMKPDGGHIFLDGEDIVGLDDFELARVHRKVGMLFQHLALFDSMTVKDNIAFPLREHHRLPEAEVLVCTQPVAALQASSVQGLPSSQLMVVPTQAPFTQWSLVVQALLSLQVAVLLLCTQPVAELHESSVQGLLSLQLMVVPAQAPFEHVSLLVQALLSLQGALLFTCMH